MKVHELIELLQSAPDPNMPVVMSGDGEGNRIGPLFQVELCHYTAYNSWRGDFTDETDAGGVPAVVLWPMN